MEQLLKGGFDGLDDLMGERGCTGEPNIEAVIPKLLRLEKDKRPFDRQFVFPCLDTRVLDVLGELREHERTITRWGSERLHFLNRVVCGLFCGDEGKNTAAVEFLPDFIK